MSKTAEAPAEDQTAEAPVDVTALVGDLASMSPIEQVAALQNALKGLKSTASETMKADAIEKFTPMAEMFLSAITALTPVEGKDYDAERAAHAAKWIGENITEYRKLARTYLKVVHGTAIPRNKGAEAEGDDNGAEDAGE